MMDTGASTDYEYPQFDVQLSNNFGYVGTTEATRALKEFFEIQKALRFHARRTSTNFGRTDILKMQKKKYHWAEGDHVGGEGIPFDGIPFIILDKNVYECEYGANHKIKKKERRTAELDKEVDAGKDSQRRGPRNQEKCKKRNCPAKIRMKEVMKFPDFQIDGDSRYKRNRIAEMLSDAIAKGAVRGEKRIYMYFPSDSEHRGHTMRSQVCATRQQVDGAIIHLIDQLVGDGVTSIEEITQKIERVVEEAQQGSAKTATLPPSDDDIRYHIQAAQIIHTYSTTHQRDLEEHVSRWRLKYENQKMFFRKSSNEDKLLLVHQTLDQQRILDRYVLDGKCFLDSTCKTTRASLPLLLVSVQGGDDHHQEIVAMAILEEKSQGLVKEALEVLKSWNPAWRPESFTAEYEEEELTALEECFEGVPIHVCDYHRITAWTKWAQDPNHWVYSNHTLVAVLESLANARTAEAYCQLLDQFKSSALWRCNTSLREWFSSIWLPNYTMWSQAFLSSKQNPKNRSLPLASEDAIDQGSKVESEETILRNSLKEQCQESLERLRKLAEEAGDSATLTRLLAGLGRVERTLVWPTFEYRLEGRSEGRERNEDDPETNPVDHKISVEGHQMIIGKHQMKGDDQQRNLSNHQIKYEHSQESSDDQGNHADHSLNANDHDRNLDLREGVPEVHLEINLDDPRRNSEGEGDGKDEAGLRIPEDGETSAKRLRLETGNGEVTVDTEALREAIREGAVLLDSGMITVVINSDTVEENLVAMQDKS